MDRCERCLFFAGASLFLMVLALSIIGASPVLSQPAPDREQPELVRQPGGHRPQVAIIIDDMGYNRPLGRRFLELPLRLSFSFLPEAPYARELAEEAFQRHHDILVHLPMEPKDSSWHLGPEALKVGDSPESIANKLSAMVAAVPHAQGANNHMGSRFTEQEAAMRVVAQTLRQHSLFFIDSVTTPLSRGLAMARQIGVESARRQVFLDNVQEVGPICRQLTLLAAQAEKLGQAIAIGHPSQATLTALNQCGPTALAGLDLVGAHRLVR